MWEQGATLQHIMLEYSNFRVKFTPEQIFSRNEDTLSGLVLVALEDFTLLSWNQAHMGFQVGVYLMYCCKMGRVRYCHEVLGHKENNCKKIALTSRP